MTLLRRLEAVLADGSVWRARDLLALGITATTISRAVQQGSVELVSRGTYRSASVPRPVHGHLAEVFARAPQGLVCLLSAAAVHDLGDVEPSAVWLALPHGVSPPTLQAPEIRPVHWRRPEAFSIGVEIQAIAGHEVPITSPARTVVDMLRMGSTVGDDRALTCLRDYLAAGGEASRLFEITADLGAGQRIETIIRTAIAMRPR